MTYLDCLDYFTIVSRVQVLLGYIASQLTSCLGVMLRPLLK